MSAELPDLAIVVRGGIAKDHGSMRVGAMKARERLGFYALSVYAKPRDPGQSVKDTVGQLVHHGGIENRRILVTTAGRLRARGFELVRTGPDPLHYSVVLDDTGPATFIRFEKSFDPPQENPS